MRYPGRAALQKQVIREKMDRLAQPTAPNPQWSSLAVEPIGELNQFGDVIHFPLIPGLNHKVPNFHLKKPTVKFVRDWIVWSRVFAQWFSTPEPNGFFNSFPLASSEGGRPSSPLKCTGRQVGPTAGRD